MKKNYLRKSLTFSEAKDVGGKEVIINNENYYKIENVDAMRPFFMSIVSPYNHWLFISSNGSLSAGRKDSNNALFPYYTDDKITELQEITGNKTIFKIFNKNEISVWEPFSLRNY